jgi:hypothetical protein
MACTLIGQSLSIGKEHVVDDIPITAIPGICQRTIHRSFGKGF